MKRCVGEPEGERRLVLHLSSELNHQLDKAQQEFNQSLAELFFLQNGGNLLDFHTWYAKPNPYLENYIQQIMSADSEGVCTMLETIPTGLIVVQPAVKKEEHSATPFMLNIASIARGDNGIVERAKQEAIIVQQVALLKKQGVWSLKRLPKVKEPNRIKTHWDYLLEEMQWLATDFHQERKWKKAAAKKLALAVAKVFEDRELAEQRKGQEEEKRMRKIANNIAKDVMKMWGAVEKVLQYKQESQLEERRKKLMDSHLNFIVGQTEQYSSWLAEGMTRNETSSIMMTPSSQDGDIEFKPPKDESSDDEATIAQAEEDNKEEIEDEIKQLQSQSLMDIEELVESLPPGMLEGFGKESARELSSDYDGHSDSADDETTIRENEQDQDKDKEELEALEDEKDIPIDELIARYVAKKERFSGSSGRESGMDGSSKSSSGDRGDKSTSSGSISSTVGSTTDHGESELAESEDDVSDMDADIEYSDNVSETKQKSSSEMDAELGELLKEATQTAPTGNTLKSATVQTKIPFLMRGTLREYQHIGLDWLVAMDQKKLNGILADEMGLGKTIQTIALLAHLACFKGIWGPHLIIVPTSVLLNWDLEFKKWCPGFKVMSYYGNQKERKEKRVGWTKPNYFHVCVTSYKLVVQDYRAFRCKKWYYMILDEAHNIKNFKSQRWQLLLNFNSQRRLLLTGTPLQNHLMELWSLMHFLMPTVFGSQKAFKEWFSNPLTGMVEGTQEYNEQIITRLHKVLRPFLLRRLKKEVELQLPSKSESVIMCGLSRRQRTLYEEFLSRSSTRDTLATGQFISVIGVLMQLRKVCNHPDLFESRPVVSPLSLHPLLYSTPNAVIQALQRGPLTSSINLEKFNLNLANYELNMSAHSAHRTQQLKTHRLLIEEIDYKGAIPDNPEYCTSTHSAFAPPRPPSSTLPPLPILRQMPTLSAGPRVPRTSPRPPPSPRQLSASGDSSGLTPPPLTYLPSTAKSTKGSPGTPSQIVPAGYFRDPVSGMVLPLVDPGMPPPRRPFPPQLTRRTGPRVPRYTSKRGAPGLPPALTPGSCSSPEPPTLRAASLPPALSPARQTDLVEYSPRSSWESPSRSSDTGAESCDEPEFEQKTNYGPLYLPSLEDLRQAWRYSRRKMLADSNDLRCQRVPLYGSDLVSAVTLGDRLPHIKYRSVEERLESLGPILSRYLLYCPKVIAPVPFLTTSCPLDTSLLDEEVKTRMNFFHPIKSRLSMSFPETRLIQYDCGKLQTLDRLMSRLKKEGHRALIFTQMTKMLDVLEKFLNYHAHTYMRLDGTTKVDKRLELMERFNQDDRVFCMILSTRSGGVGVNLTGADTVIFYDSDWNPTMDAQAQDRCHRIGQTRDVHIYRLVCEKTVEENILKKANQKRLLGAVAIEDGHFTTAFFKKDNLSELFGTSVVPLEPGAKASPKHRTIEKGDLEMALAAAEDDEDVTAATRAKGEIVEEMADFDEEVPIKGERALSDQEKEMIKEEKEFTKAEEELISIENELTPVERYALKFLESENQEYLDELIRLQDEELAAAKPEATLADLQAAKEDEEFQASHDQNDVLLTYASWDPQFEDEEPISPAWYPPTPPHQCDDVYHHDPVLQTLYTMDHLMREDSLPPVTIIPNLTFPIIPPSIHIKEEPQDPPPPPAPCIPVPVTPAPPLHPVKVESITPSPAEEAVITKQRSSTPQPSSKDHNDKQTTPFLRGTSSSDMSRKDMSKRHKKTKLKIKPTEPLSENSDDQNQWLLSEEYALHQSVMSIQETSPQLSSINEYNWDIVSDILNISSSSYRTPKQCRERYTLLLHREDISTDQSRFNKALRPGPPRGPNPPGGEDAGHASTQHFVKIFQEIDKLGFSKPELERKTLTLASIIPNTGHTEILTNHGVVGDENPVALAAKRKERENKENKERQTQHQRKELEAKRMDLIQNNNVQKIQEVGQRGVPVNNNIPTQPYHMARKMNEIGQGQAPRGPTISVMTSNKMPFNQHTPIYLVPQAQRPMQVQQQVNMTAGNMLQQGKQILVNTGQQHVKMQTHVNFIPGTQVRTPQGTHQYIPCSTSDEMIQQMKRGQYRAPSPIGHPNNLIPINMLSKPFISQQQYIPQQLRGTTPKGVRSMHPPIMQRGMPMQPGHVMDDGMHHAPRMVNTQMMGQMGPPATPGNMPPSSGQQIPSSPHQVPSPVHPPQVMQQIKQTTASTSRTM